MQYLLYARSYTIQTHLIIQKMFSNFYAQNNMLVYSISNSMDINLTKLWEIVQVREDWRATVHGVTVRHDLVTEEPQHVVSGKQIKTFLS